MREPDLTAEDAAKLEELVFEYLERRTDEDFEGAKQEAETLMAEIEKMFPEVERIVASSDFGRDAISKARTVLERAREAISRKDADAVREQVEGLARTQRMFKGVVSRAQ